MIHYILFFAFLTSVCNLNISDSTKIQGRFHPDSHQTVYLKKIDYFQKNEKPLIVDSAYIDHNKKFSFELNIDMPGLFYLSTNNEFLATVSYFNQYPDRYYYSFCSKYYSNGIYLFIEPRNSVSIEWWANDWPKDSVSYAGAQGLSQQFFKEFYSKVSKEDYSDNLYEGSNYKRIAPAMAQKIVNKAKERMIDYVQENKDKFSINLYNYFITEIELGALNQFLNWYEYVYEDSLRHAFASDQLPDFYVNAFNTYDSSEKWNKLSIEFYKFTERYVTFNANKASNEFKKYYGDTDLKVTIASRCLNDNVKMKYIKKITTD